MAAQLVLDASAAPYSALYQANRFAVRSADGSWFFAVQDGTLGRVLHYIGGAMVNIPLNPPPTMRPTLYADPSGLYAIAGFDGDKNRIPIWHIEEYQTVYTAGAPDPRIDALAQQITQIETALRNISQEGGGLAPEDVEALRRAKVWLGIS